MGVMSEWISVKKERPISEGKYLVNGTYGVGCAYFFDFGYFQDCSTKCDEGMDDFDGTEFAVTHWMPLPKPPIDSEESDAGVIPDFKVESIKALERCATLANGEGE